jgi:hypothetical protein
MVSNHHRRLAHTSMVLTMMIPRQDLKFNAMQIVEAEQQFRIG